MVFISIAVIGLIIERLSAKLKVNKTIPLLLAFGCYSIGMVVSWALSGRIRIDWELFTTLCSIIGLVVGCVYAFGATRVSIQPKAYFKKKTTKAMLILAGAFFIFWFSQKFIFLLLPSILGSEILPSFVYTIISLLGTALVFSLSFLLGRAVSAGACIGYTLAIVFSSRLYLPDALLDIFCIWLIAYFVSITTMSIFQYSNPLRSSRQGLLLLTLLWISISFFDFSLRLVYLAGWYYTFFSLLANAVIAFLLLFFFYEPLKERNLLYPQLLEPSTQSDLQNSTVIPRKARFGFFISVAGAFLCFALKLVFLLLSDHYYYINVLSWIPGVILFAIGARIMNKSYEMNRQ